MPISQIIFHSVDKKKLKAQIRSSKSLGLEVTNCYVLNTPKSVVSEILLEEGIVLNHIGDFNHKIQQLGNNLSQDWIELLSKQTKLSVWESFTIKDSLVTNFQYSTLLNRNREVSTVYDDLIGILVILNSVKIDRSSCLIVSDDHHLLDVFTQLGFTIAVKRLKAKFVIDRTLSILVGIIKRIMTVLAILWLKYNTRQVHRKVINDCSINKNIWIASTFLPSLVSTSSGHDERYRDISENIQRETDTALLYAGWIGFEKNALNLKVLLEKYSKKNSHVILVSNFLSFRQLIDYVLPVDFFRAFLIFFRKRSELEQNFHGVPMYTILAREFWNSYLCSGNSNETFYYYRLIENSYSELFKKIRPIFVTTFLEGYNFGRSIIAACRRLEIKVLGWQESVLHPMRLYYRWGNEMLTEGLESRNVNATYLFPDKFCVWSRDSKDFLVSKGIPDKRIIEIGATRYLRFADQNLAAGELTHHPTSQSLLLVGTAFLFESISMIEFITDALNGNSNIKIIFRPHPQTKNIFIKRKKCGQFQNIRISANPLDIDLQWANFVVSSWSTMLCEAFFMGKQCASIFTSGWISQPPLPEKLCKYFSDTHSFREWIIECPKSELSEAFLRSTRENLFGFTNINSGKRLQNFVL